MHRRFSLTWKWSKQKFQSEFRILTVSFYNGYGQGTCLWNIYHCVSNTSLPDRCHCNFLLQRIRQPDGAYQDLKPQDPFSLKTEREVKLSVSTNIYFSHIFFFLKTRKQDQQLQSTIAKLIRFQFCLEIYLWYQKFDFLLFFVLDAYQIELFSVFFI